MKTHYWLRVLLSFLAGVAVTLAVTFGFLYGQDAQAQSPCVRSALEAYHNAGVVPGPEIRVAYRIPSCLASLGYTADQVALLNSGGVCVIYKKH